MPTQELIWLIHVNGCAIALYLPVTRHGDLPCLLRLPFHIPEIPFPVQQLVIRAAAIVECGCAFPVPVGHECGARRKLPHTQYGQIPVVRQ